MQDIKLVAREKTATQPISKQEDEFGAVKDELHMIESIRELCTKFERQASHIEVDFPLTPDEYHWIVKLRKYHLQIALKNVVQVLHSDDPLYRAIDSSSSIRALMRQHLQEQLLMQLGVSVNLAGDEEVAEEDEEPP